MDISETDNETDFRPFFDMVIGILFVLLILVAAQIYFQQTDNQTVANEAAKQEAALRRADIATFLTTLSDRLRAGGLAATADADKGTVLMPLGEVLGIDAAGLPTVAATLSGRLGPPLAELLACVTAPRSTARNCEAFARLGLDALAVTARLGAVPSGAALPRDRFADLGAALLSARLFGEHPVLIGASNATGGRVVTFGTAYAGPGTPGVLAAPGVIGELVFDFTFH